MVPPLPGRKGCFLLCHQSPQKSRAVCGGAWKKERKLQAEPQKDVICHQLESSASQWRGPPVSWTPSSFLNLPLGTASDPSSCLCCHPHERCSRLCWNATLWSRHELNESMSDKVFQLKDLVNVWLAAAAKSLSWRQLITARAEIDLSTMSRPHDFGYLGARKVAGPIGRCLGALCNLDPLFFFLSPGSLFFFSPSCPLHAYLVKVRADSFLGTEKEIKQTQTKERDITTNAIFHHLNKRS